MTKFFSFMLVGLFYFCFPVIADGLSHPSFTLGQLMEAVPEIKESHPNLSIDKKFVGTKFNINGQTYEWHYFHFSDPAKKLPQKLTFADYVSNHDLSKMRSLAFHPVEGLTFDCFDASRAAVDDEAYFNIVIRRIED